MSQGQDLRTLLADSLQRERNTAHREREAADRSLQLVQRFALGATVALALAAMLASMGFSRALRRPLEALKAGAQALQGGDLSHRVPHETADEFGEVARTINRMATELERHRAREEHARHELESQVRTRTAELQDALTALRHADERRRQLLADVSHELRTPTTAIRGEAEIALRGAPKTGEEYQSTLTQIADAARHLGTVIDDLLTLARVETDALPLKRQRLSPEQPLDEACEQARSAAQQRRVNLKRYGPARTADTTTPHGLLRMEGDAARLRQVFGIVLDNAIQYSRPDTTIEVLTGAVALDDGRTGWEVCVRDQGVGIAAHELPHVMNRHFRGQQAQHLAPDGLGLGLSLAQGIVRAHGGWMDLDSTPGEGTEVRLVLPCTTEQD
jgi:signal transduction histidine kinase